MATFLHLLLAVFLFHRFAPLPCIIVALRHPDRVCEIDLGVTSSMPGSILEVIQEPFPALEHIKARIKSNGTTGSPVYLAHCWAGLPPLRQYSLSRDCPSLPSTTKASFVFQPVALSRSSFILSIGQIFSEDLATGFKSSALTRLNT